jgi:hypothetical protein
LLQFNFIKKGPPASPYAGHVLRKSQPCGLSVRSILARLREKFTRFFCPVENLFSGGFLTSSTGQLPYN